MLRAPIIQLALVVTVLAGALLILHGWTGVPDGASYRHNIPWMDGFYAAFWSGDVYPRRISGLWYGLGGLDFYFYAPMPFWVSSLAGPLLAPGGGAVMIALSAASFYAFARHFYAHGFALAGALIYAVLPYHYLTNWFMRQAVGEVAAMAVIPLVALGAAQLMSTPRRGGRLLATSFAALTLCHLPGALITALFIAAMTGFHLLRPRPVPEPMSARVRDAAPFVLWGGLGAALGALYWLPALALLDEVSSSLLFNAYATPTAGFLLDGQPEPNPVTMSVVRMQFVALAVAALGLIIARRGSDGTALSWALGPLLFGAVMMTPVSAPLWTHTPLQAAQFPWRSNMIVDLGLALALVEFLRQWHTGAGRRTLCAAMGGIGLLAIVQTGLTALPHAAGAAERGRALDGEALATGAAEYLPPAVYEAIDARFEAAGTEARSSAAQYQSWFSEARMVRDEATADAAADARAMNVIDVTGQRIRIAVDMGPDGGDLRVPIPYWHHWQARLDGTGASLSLRPEPSLGITVITLPPGLNRVTFVLRPTAAERLASAVSLLAAMILLMSLAGRIALQLRQPAFRAGKLDEAPNAG